MDVSENSGFSSKSSILMGFSTINHPFWGTPIFGNTHILPLKDLIHQTDKQWNSNHEQAYLGDVIINKPHLATLTNKG